MFLTNKIFKTPTGEIVEYLDTVYNPYLKEDLAYFMSLEDDSFFYERTSKVISEYEVY